MKGFIIIKESHRETTDVYASEIVHTKLEDAMQEFREVIADAKDRGCTEDEWLSEALAERPEDIKEKWHTGRYVTYEDTLVGDSLDVYIHEVEIK